jgi:hypothetical protein
VKPALRLARCVDVHGAAAGRCSRLTRPADFSAGNVLSKARLGALWVAGEGPSRFQRPLLGSGKIGRPETKRAEAEQIFRGDDGEAQKPRPQPASKGTEKQDRTQMAWARTMLAN